MGNIMICGSLCDSCSATVKDGDNLNPNNIEQILIKEIFEREKITKIIDKEINNLRILINKNDIDIKQKSDDIKNNLANNILKIKQDGTLDIFQIKSQIEKIKDNHLFHIEKDINIIKTKFENFTDDIVEIKDLLKDINKTTIRNTTRLDLLKI
jgi:hypothetical protein